MYLVARQRERGAPRGPSLFIAYLFWLCCRLHGLHRFYLRNRWGFAFIPVFLLILFTTAKSATQREDVSRTRAAVEALTGRTRAEQSCQSARPATPEMTRSTEQGEGRRRRAPKPSFASAEVRARPVARLRVGSPSDRRDAVRRCGTDARALCVEPISAKLQSERNAPPDVVVPDVPTDRYARRPDA